MTTSFTPTTNANAIPTVIAQEVIRLLPANLGIAKFVSRDTDWTGQDFASYGDTLNIVKPGSLVAKKKTPGTPTVTQNPSDDKIQVKLDQHAYIDILQEDITKLLQKPDMQQAYAQRMSVTLAEQIESDVFSIHPSITNVVTWNRTDAAAVEASFLALRAKFARLKVPQGEQKGVFFDTSIITDLLANQKYSSGDYVDSKVMAEGAIRRIYAMNIFESQLVPTSGSPVAYHNIATTPWGIVLVNRPMPLDGNGRGVRQTTMIDPGTGLAFRMTEGYSQGDLGVRMTLDTLYGYGIGDVNQIIEVESF